jgi:hypothetical protein
VVVRHNPELQAPSGAWIAWSALVNARIKCRISLQSLYTTECTDAVKFYLIDFIECNFSKTVGTPLA